MVHQLSQAIFSYWGDTPSSILPSFLPVVALKIFRLEPWWDFLHSTKWLSCQWTRARHRLCQLQIICLEHSGAIIRNLQSMWGTELAAVMWYPVAKDPLPKVWQSNTNFYNMFSWLFELESLAHFEMLHTQHWNNLDTHCVGRAEGGPRGLVWQREIFVEQI